jgi:hypothetical protein
MKHEQERLQIPSAKLRTRAQVVGVHYDFDAISIIYFCIVFIWMKYRYRYRWYEKTTPPHHTGPYNI